MAPGLSCPSPGQRPSCAVRAPVDARSCAVRAPVNARVGARASSGAGAEPPGVSPPRGAPRTAAAARAGHRAEIPQSHGRPSAVRLLDEIADHGDEAGIGTRGRGPDEADAALGGGGGGGPVEVVHHLHVVRDEPDRAPRSPRRRPSRARMRSLTSGPNQGCCGVRTGSGKTSVQRSVRHPGRRRDQVGRLSQLALVVADGGHRHRDAVGAHEHRGVGSGVEPGPPGDHRPGGRQSRDG